MFKNISKKCLKIFQKMSRIFQKISNIFQKFQKISKKNSKKCKKNTSKKFKKILAVPDPALLGFDYFPIYYLLIIAVSNSALLNIYI